MSLLGLIGKKYVPFSRSNILRNRNFIRCVQRQYSLLKQTGQKSNHQKNSQANLLKSHHLLRKDFRFLSSLLTRYGFHREAIIAKELAGQVRCFSTSQHLGKEHSDRDKKDEDEKAQNPDDEDDDEELQERAKREVRTLFTIGTIFIFYLIYISLTTPNDNTLSSLGRVITWKEFYHEMLLKGEVDKIDVLEDGMVIVHAHPGAIVKGESAKRYFLKLPTEFKFEEKIREAERQLGISPENGVSIYYAKTHESQEPLFQIGLIMLVLLLWMLRAQAKGKGGAVGKSPPKTGSNPFDFFDGITKAKFTRVDSSTDVGKQKITFKDVAGLQEAKIEVMEFVDYLKKPSIYKELGAKIPKGALLLGPPGCGKTLLAKAVSTEANVPFLAMAGSEFVEMVGGLGAARVRSLFEQARKEAPCIVYIDEIDAIGRQRGGGGSEEEHTLNQLLVELDGMGTTEGVILLGSTNRADVLDKALLRSGRFDRHITIDFPTLAERKEMFDMYMERLTLASSYPKLSEKLAHLTPRMTGADIANVCNESALHAARVNKKSIDVSDFDYAVERVIAGVAKKSTTLSAAERKIIAYHESGHALVGWMLKHTDALLKISIIPRTSRALGFVQSSPSNNLLVSKEMLFEQMCMTLGGRVAESLIFNSVTTGAEDDLKKVTKIAYNQVKSFGMNETVGLLSFPDDGTKFGTKPFSKKLSAVIDEEARNLVVRAYKQTEAILLENKEKLHFMAKTLLDKEVLTYEEVEKLIGPPPHGPKEKVDINPIENLDIEDASNTDNAPSDDVDSAANEENNMSK